MKEKSERVSEIEKKGMKVEKVSIALDGFACRREDWTKDQIKVLYSIYKVPR